MKEIGVKAFFRLFEQAPHLPQIQDAEVVKKDYKYWRIRTLYSMFIGYAFYYFARKSFTFAMPGLIEDLHFEKGDLGILGSILYITYAISKFASSAFSDRYQCSPRFFMAFGLIMTGIVNILFGLSSSFWLFAIFWGLNGWFQGFGWPPCGRLLTYWYSQNERGSWWSTWSISQNVGAFVIPWIVGACILYFDWRTGMYVPGVICILGGLFLINRLRDTPQSLGLPCIEEFRGDYKGVDKSDLTEEQLTFKQLLFDYVLNNKYIWMLAIAYFFVYIVRIGIGDWTALFLYEEKGYSRLGANGSVSLFEAGGFLGALSAGWASDKLFGARRGPVNVLFATGMLTVMVLFWWVPAGYHLIDSSLIFSLGFMTFGPQMLIGVAAAEMAHKKAASTANGFVGLISYLGAAMSGYPLGLIIDKLGWGGLFCSLSVCCALATCALLPTWNALSTKKKEEKVVA
jgi:OPA family sugar phosphate sensor protein UhpC-like MFS transporter